MADKRLIDANAIPWEECFIPVEGQHGWKFKRDESAYKSAIDQMPTVEAVEVVRCKDCKHLYDRIGYYCCRNHSGLARISENSFCSYGERSGKT